MSPTEVMWRARDQFVQAAWSGRQVRRQQVLPAASTRERQKLFTAVLPPGVAALVPEQARKDVLAAADDLLRGVWEVLGLTRTDVVLPDWFQDPLTGHRAPADLYAFRINHRAEEITGNVKQIWELSRLQHLTLLATAWFLTHDDAYASRAADQLRSWWQENPFLSGVHWTSGIEIGLRLISMTWIRRLLDQWPPVVDLFERNDLARRQIRWHQQYLDKFQSRGSSANNHVIAEAAGQFVASCAFPWFPESQVWKRKSKDLLERELIRNSFSSGICRELASDYQCFVAELGLLAVAEGRAANCALSLPTQERLCAMVDATAALLDEHLRPPRQGDGDEGRALLLDGPTANPSSSLLSVGGALFGRLPWWPQTATNTASAIIGGWSPCEPMTGRPSERPWNFSDAGTALLRTREGREPEIWCRCDGGPHGYLSIAAHAHADALSVEAGYVEKNILADPGTYCYHGEPQWRSYFRSTIAHNTLQIDGRSQSDEGGPFLWTRHANASVIDALDVGDAVEWVAEHDGYLALQRPARHRRCVRLDRASRILDIVDEVEGSGHDVRLAFHLGPEVEAYLQDGYALLSWPLATTPGTARLDLPRPLHWSLHRGETDPILGWYSTGLGRRTPTIVLIRRGHFASGGTLSTRLEFLDIGAETPGHQMEAG